MPRRGGGGHRSSSGTHRSGGGGGLKSSSHTSSRPSGGTRSGGGLFGGGGGLKSTPKAPQVSKPTGTPEASGAIGSQTQGYDRNRRYYRRRGIYGWFGGGGDGSGGGLRTILIVLGVVVCIILAFAAVLYYISQNRSPASELNALPAEISVAAAYQKYQEGAFLLDVRQPEEWDEYHATGATLIPLGELASRLDEVPSDREIVVICRSGNRSQEGRDILLANGFTAVTSVSGGMLNWSAAGYPIEGTAP